MTYLCLVLGVFAWAFIGGAFLRDWQVSRQRRRRDAHAIERTIMHGAKATFGEVEILEPEPVYVPIPSATVREVPLMPLKPNGSGGHRPKGRGKKAKRRSR